MAKLPADKQARKDRPIASGVLDYFPDALAAVALVSKLGNDQHNPGQPLHWSRGISDDHPDCLIRHFLERGTLDTDGTLHSAKVAWRALAILQLEIEAGRSQLENAYMVMEQDKEILAHLPDTFDLKTEVEKIVGGPVEFGREIYPECDKPAMEPPSPHVKHCWQMQGPCPTPAKCDRNLACCAYHPEPSPEGAP